MSDGVESQYLGLIDFDKALELQHQYHAKVSADKKAYILGLEHPLVMTLGLRAHKLDVNSFCSKPWTAPVFKISRGGLATIHNPGQLVIYPIVDLKYHDLSVKQFVQVLFEATQKTLHELGVESTFDLCDQPGVYTSKGKIAFCGLQIKNGITLHGLSINVQNDILVFSDIESCGVTAPQIDSVKAQGVAYSPRAFFELWLKHFNLEAGHSLSNASCE
ncbi:MAG: lipoyl(octanoyl) transferase LipB [Pseudobdellovibrio sp.]|nr:lipoyl(octanoyl) transferase LipB [Pseudobdellovibrio sp.]